MTNVLLIIPCYNEEQRINLDSFLNFQKKELFTKDPSHPLKISYLFANDGSKDNTSALISSYIAKNQLQTTWFLFNNPQNTGKANAISNAYNWFKNHHNSQASGSNSSLEIQNFDWIGYWDADLATPLFEARNMIHFRNEFYSSKQALFGSRVLKLGSRIVRKPLRHYLGRVFATAIFLALRVGSYDSQCGAKLFSQKIADKALSKPFISPWIFDVEIMLRIGEENIVEYPLTEWEDIPGSKIKIVRECFRVLKDIFRIRKTYLR